jgi:spore germination protein GerM
MKKLALILIVVAGCGGDEETRTVYLKQRLGPEGPRGQIAPVLMPVAREPRDGIPAAHQAVLELRVGPSPDERAHGFLDTLEPETRVRSVAVDGGTATVELAGAEPNEFYAHGAIVYSLTELPGIDRVAFRLDGKPCCVYHHDGTVRTEPLIRRVYDYWQGEPCGERDQPDAVHCRG